MGTRPPIEQLQHEPQIARWSLASRVSFRFFFAYFGLYCLATQIFASLFPIPNVDIPDLSARWPLRQIIFWTAAHVFLVPPPLVYSNTGSGDKTFDWVLVFCLLVFATLSTVLWSTASVKITSRCINGSGSSFVFPSPDRCLPTACLKSFPCKCLFHFSPDSWSLLAISPQWGFSGIPSELPRRTKLSLDARRCSADCCFWFLVPPCSAR